MRFKNSKTVALSLAGGLIVIGCFTSTRPPARAQLRNFDRFGSFERIQNNGSTVLVSPVIKVAPWNELIVSWNADCPPGTALTVQARAFEAEKPTRFYTIAHWSAESGTGKTSLRKEGDADGAVETDTLICHRPMNAAQVRIHLAGTNNSSPRLKLLTLSFLNSSIPPSAATPNHAAWGKVLDVPERSQLGYPDASGWCSPTAVSMILAYWSQRLNRPELNQPVPTVAQAVYDPAYHGTGNWAFNMAYAGSFARMRAYATRFDDFRQIEDCIVAGVPVALSVSFDLLNGKEKDMNSGHLIVVIGFTDSGEVVVNDPWPNPKKENRVRKIFPRNRVIEAWQRSKQTVYLIQNG